METAHTQSPDSELHISDLKFLLDAFRSSCSLDDIAQAYADAKCDVNAASENLVNLQSTKSNTVQSCDDSCNRVVSYVQSEDDSLGYDNTDTVKSSRVSKKKKSFASTGTISSFLGSRIIPPHQPRQPPNGSLQPSKPLKLELIQPEPLVDTEVLNSPPETASIRDSDVADFLFSMLQYGFNLDMAKIQEVLSSCGYNGKECMEELLDTSATNLIKDKEKTCTENFADNHSHVKSHLHKKKPPSNDVSHGEVAKSLTSQEVLESLFKPSMEEDEEVEPLKGTSWKSRRLNRRIVSEPIVDTDSTKATHIPKQYNRKKEEDDNFEVLRRAVKQHWNSMKEYYRAAIDAFTQGDRDKANHLLEEGKYHNKMAREADEKSVIGNIGATRSTDDHDIFTLDLHIHGVSGALSLLKTHLRSIAINFSHLRVIVDSDSEDTTKGRRKQSVIRFLKRKQIPWSEEEENPGVFLIKMDLIDPEMFRKRRDDD